MAGAEYRFSNVLLEKENKSNLGNDDQIVQEIRVVSYNQIEFNSSHAE